MCEKGILLNHVPSWHNTSPAADLIELPITLIELESCLCKAKNKTPGFDRISYSILKNCPLTLKNRVLNLYNEIFAKGTIPQTWKTASVVPIPKPNKKPNEVDGYRPISLLPCTGKILEKIISTRLLWFLEKHKFIDYNQVAFKHGRSTSDALLHIDEYISSALSTKNHVSILSIDFEKAFDRIGIHVVLNKLIKWKIGPKIFRYIKSFLTNRKFRIKINGTYSTVRTFQNGIPQGSPLLVLIFIITFNELSEILTKYKLIEHSLYADDLFILSKCKDLAAVASMFSDILQELSSWCNISGSKISLAKTKILHICKKN